AGSQPYRSACRADRADAHLVGRGVCEVSMPIQPCKTEGLPNGTGREPYRLPSRPVPSKRGRDGTKTGHIPTCPAHFCIAVDPRSLCFSGFTGFGGRLSTGLLPELLVRILAKSPGRTVGRPRRMGCGR